MHTDARVLETHGNDDTGNGRVVGQSAVTLLQIHVLVIDFEGGCYIDDRTTSQLNRSIRVVCTDQHVRVLVPVQVQSTGKREAERPQAGIIELGGKDDLRVLGRQSTAAAIEDVHRAATVFAVIRCTDSDIYLQ